eukprot:GEMP01010800.1.p1 GENE.GEMP01010800.1~~GEMP01010800.1.p1  ORF type:complete len:678 (+),score=110.15 GEMP01010800.1:37-2070(+)
MPNVECMGLDVPYKAMASAFDFSAWIEKNAPLGADSSLEKSGVSKGNKQESEDSKPKSPSKSDVTTTTTTKLNRKESVRGGEAEKVPERTTGTSASNSSNSDHSSKTDKKLQKPDSATNKISRALVNKIYRVGRKLGAGAFGDIFSGVNVLTDEKVAIKMERRNSASPQVLFEAALYSEIGACRGFPKVHWAGHHGNFNVMVMDVLGPSLDDLFRYCKRRFSLKTLIMLAIQMLTAFEYMHRKNYIHRDIKPSNFLMGLGEEREIMHIIDLGLAKRYYDGELDQHVTMKEGKGLVGTAKFASVNSHMGIELSRRDDMEAVGYVLIYFLRGSLPWQGLGVRNTKEQMHVEIMKNKLSTSIPDLCRVAPKEFVTYFEYVRSLTFEEEPNYTYLRDLFKSVWKRNTFIWDYAFDWTQEVPDTAGQAVPKIWGTPDNLGLSTGDEDAKTPSNVAKAPLAPVNSRIGVTAAKSGARPKKFGKTTSIVDDAKKIKGAVSKEIHPVLPEKMMPRKKLWLCREHPLQTEFLAGSVVRCRNSKEKGVVLGEFLGSLLVKWRKSNKETIMKKELFDDSADEKTGDCVSRARAQESRSADPVSRSDIVAEVVPLPDNESPENVMPKKRKLIKVKVKAKPSKAPTSSLWGGFGRCVPCGNANPKNSTLMPCVDVGELTIGEVPSASVSL